MVFALYLIFPFWQSDCDEISLCQLRTARSSWFQIAALRRKPLPPSAAMKKPKSQQLCPTWMSFSAGGGVANLCSKSRESSWAMDPKHASPSVYTFGSLEWKYLDFIPSCEPSPLAYRRDYDTEFLLNCLLHQHDKLTKKQDETREPECRHVCWETEVAYLFVTISSEHSCGTPWLDTLSWQFCRTPLLDTIALRSGKTLLHDTLIWHSSKTLLLDTLVRHFLLDTPTCHSSKTLLLNTLVGHFLLELLTWHSSGTLLLDTLVRHSCLTDTLLRHSYLTLLLRHSFLIDTLLAHSYLTLLLRHSYLTLL